MLSYSDQQLLNDLAYYLNNKDINHTKKVYLWFDWVKNYKNKSIGENVIKCKICGEEFDKIKINLYFKSINQFLQEHGYSHLECTKRINNLNAFK